MLLVDAGLSVREMHFKGYISVSLHDCNMQGGHMTINKLSVALHCPFLPLKRFTGELEKHLNACTL